jgi:signal transduction histidine kinase/CheY-like chemotaxis protein
MKTLRARLIALVVAALIPVLVFVSVLVTTMAARERATVERGLRETTRALAQTLDGQLARYIDALQSLGSSPALDAGDFRAFYTQAALVKQRYPEWDTILVTDATGQQLANLRVPFGTPLPATPGNPAVFHEVMRTGRPVVTDVFHGPVARGPVVGIRVPVLRQGQPRFMISAGMAPETFSRVLDAPRLSDGWVGTIYDRQLAIVTRTPFPERFVGRPAGSALSEAARGASEGFLHSADEENVLTYVAFDRAPATGWTVALGVPAASVDAPLRRSLLLVVAAGAGFYGLGVALAIVFARGIARPIRALVRRARTLAQDDATFTPTPAVIREIDDLGRVLDHARHGAMRLTAQYEATRILADARDLDDAVARILGAVGSNIGWDVGAYWAPAPDGDTLECRTFWRRETVAATAFEAESRARRFPLDVGLPGRVWTSRRPEWIVSAAEEDNFPRQAAAVADGLATGLGFPIALGPNTYAVMEFFSCTRRPPDPALLAMAESLGTQIGQYAARLAVEHERTTLLQSEQAARAHAEAARRRAEALGEITAVLASSLDVESALARLADLVVPLLADICAIDLVAADGGIHRVAVAHVDRSRAEELLHTRRAHGYHQHGFVATVLRSGRSELVRHVPDGGFPEPATPERTALFRALGLNSAMFVALRAGGRVVGVLSLGATVSARRYDTEDLQHAEEVAYRAATAIANAQLYEQAAAGRLAAEDAARRAHLLAEASRRLAGSLDYVQTISAVLEAALPLLGDWAEAHISRRGRGFQRIGPVCVDPAVEPLARAVADSAPSEGWRTVDVLPRRQLAAGQTVLLPDVSPAWIAENVAEGSYARALHAAKPRAMLMAPLVIRGRTIGSLLFLRTRDGRAYAPPDIELATDLGRRAAAAIENAQLHERADAARYEAERANRMKDEFLATLSHELRTPLNAIVGWTRMVQDGMVSGETRARGLGVIDRNARALAQLIEDLLDVSRIVTGKLRLNVTPVNPVAVIAAAIDTLRPAADAKRIRIEAAMEHEAGEIRGDAERLQQIVWNLLSNAVKFTPPGGQVTVRLRRRDTDVEIDVSDTGPGIPPEALPFIFERFRQVDGTGTRAHGGLGIGLALVRHLAEMHGGTATAASPGADQGATFTVRLPVAEAKVTAGEDMRAGATPSHGGLVPLGESLEGIRALVVDDDRDARELLGVILTHQRAHVRLVASTLEAREAVVAWRPHVVISDIQMPQEDGYSLVRWLRSLPSEEGGRVPAIAVTAYTGPEDRVRVLAAGFTLHITKPIQPDEIAIAVANVVRRLPAA